MSNLNSAGGGLQYRGTAAVQPPNCNFHDRDPNDHDRYGYSLLDIWLNTVTHKVFVLVALEGNSTSRGILAKWATLPATGKGIVSLTGNDSVVVVSDVVGNVNLIGIDPLFVTGTPLTNTETITIATATTGQIGATTLATDSQTILGINSAHAVTPSSLAAKLGTQTTHGMPYSQGPSLAIGWTAAGTDGQIPIAATGAAPVFANIVSTDRSITVTNGPNSINIEVSSPSGGSSIKTTVYDTPGSYTFTKDVLTKSLKLYGWAGGGGGANGSSGSAGGGPGCAFYYDIPGFCIDDSPATVPVIVGAGGIAETDGGPSSFGGFATDDNTLTGANVSNPVGRSKTIMTITGPAWPDFALNSLVGQGGFVALGWGNAGSLTQSAGPIITGSYNPYGGMLGTGGGGGGNGGAGNPGGVIRNRNTSAVLVAGGIGGNPGINGFDGVDTFPAPGGVNFLCGGTGGGGGGDGATTGGRGGFPSGGGGGGGRPSGTGGTGGDGLIVVIEYLST